MRNLNTPVHVLLTMEFAYYSLAIVAAFAFTRWVTENFKFHVRNKSIWLHHWIIAAIVMIVMLTIKIESEIAWGVLTGVALEGLGRKNWSILRK
tara:strand:- start:956 stop:1237 length:282 start_codon:yes stop_codon:yes gene_type:complete